MEKKNKRKPSHFRKRENLKLATVDMIKKHARLYIFLHVFRGISTEPHT